MVSSVVGAVVLLCCAADAGPRLSDADFFAGLDLKRPGMEAVAKAVEKADWPAARVAFGRYFKTHATKRWPTEQRGRRAAKVAGTDTAIADELLRHQWRWERTGAPVGRIFDLGPHIDWSSNQMTEGESATVEWNASLNRHFHFAELTRAYRLTGDDKYAAEVVAQMLSWIAECPVLLDRSGNGPYHYAWETLNTACRAGDTWPNALYAILDSQALTDDALCTILKSLVEQARHLDRWPTSSGNWLTMESVAVFTVGALLPEFREADTWRAHAIERLARQMQTDVYPDGLEIELALEYNNWVVSNFAEVFELARLNDRAQEFPADYVAQLERMFAYLAYAAMPNGITPGLNDSNNASCAELLKRGAKYFPGREDFLWVATGGKQGKRPQQNSISFPYSGHYVMRSGWDPDARFLLLDAGPFGSGHQHEDKLHLVAYAYGRQLLLDAGNYMYDRSRWRRYVLSTRGHNTVRVDGQDQNRRQRRDTYVLPKPFQPLDNTWISNDRFDYVVGRYESGYGPKGEIRVTHTRAVAFIKPDYWVLVDTLEPEDKNEHEYESLFHFGAEAAEVIEDRFVLTRNAKGPNMVLWPLVAPALHVVQGREEEPVQGWAQDPNWRPVPTAIVGYKGSGKVRLAYVLYPLPEGKASPIEAVEQLPVFAGGQKVEDAIALGIRFRDGHSHTILCADRAGSSHRAGTLETDAAIEWSDTFQAPAR